tara:strand:+ start:46 stop:264 length:219 start_codon:yes stop_codon:yes gene_type:complete
MAFKMKGPTFYKSALKHKVDTPAGKKAYHDFVIDGHKHGEVGYGGKLGSKEITGKLGSKEMQEWIKKQKQKK